MLTVAYKSHANIVTTHFSYIQYTENVMNLGSHSFWMTQILRAHINNPPCVQGAYLLAKWSWGPVLMSTRKNKPHTRKKAISETYEVREFPIRKHFCKAPQNDLMQTPHRWCHWNKHHVTSNCFYLGLLRDFTLVVISNL